MEKIIKQEYDILKITLIIAIVLFIFFLIIGLIQISKAEDICEERCLDDGAITFDKKAGGGLSVNNDICICYFKQGTKTFRIGE